MPATPSTYKLIYLYRKCGKAGWSAGWVLMVQSSRWQRSCGMSLFTADYPDFVNMLCFPCKAALLNLASPWLGPCLSAKGPFDRAVLMLRSISTASVSLLARQPCWALLTSFVLGPCLLSTKVFDTALHMSKFFLSLFSYWSLTIVFLNSISMVVIPLLTNIMMFPCFVINHAAVDLSRLLSVHTLPVLSKRLFQTPSHTVSCLSLFFL
jgi:hypothetical protein